MVVRFPNTIRYNTVTQGVAYQNADGDWVLPDPVVVERFAKCRIEPNGSGKKTPNQDGTLVEYGFTVYMPHDVEPIPFNQLVKFFDADGISEIASGECKRFHKFQRNSIAWV